MARSGSRTRRRVLVLCLLLPAGGCGSEDGALDRDDFQSVFDAGMAAVAARDLDALWPLLTERGRHRVEKNLRHWQRRLQDPEKAGRILAAIEERGLHPSETEVDLAARGTLRDVWRFFLEVDPRSAQPKRSGLELAPDGKTVTVLYLDPRGNARPVRLERLPAGWYIDDLQL